MSIQQQLMQEKSLLEVEQRKSIFKLKSYRFLLNFVSWFRLGLDYWYLCQSTFIIIPTIRVHVLRHTLKQDKGEDG